MELSESAILGFSLGYQLGQGQRQGGESILCCSRTLKLKPLAAFVPETKMVKKAQEPRGNCQSFGNSWVEAGGGGAAFQVQDPRQWSGAKFRAICVSGGGPGIPTWKPEAGSRGVCFWTDGTKWMYWDNLSSLTPLRSARFTPK